MYILLHATENANAIHLQKDHFQILFKWKHPENSSYQISHVMTCALQMKLKV